MSIAKINSKLLLAVKIAGQLNVISEKENLNNVIMSNVFTKYTNHIKTNQIVFKENLNYDKSLQKLLTRCPGYSISVILTFKISYFHINKLCLITSRNSSCGKVVFSHASVSHSVHKGWIFLVPCSF